MSISSSDQRAPLPQPVQNDAPSRSLGRYELRFELASGGMGTVYLARMGAAGGFAKLFAIKTIHAHLAKDPDFVAMFLDEAQIVARLSHPNICSVFDFGQVGDTYFMAMEYLSGETLGRLLGTLRRVRDLATLDYLPRYIAYIVAQACAGLHAAHELHDDHGQPLGLVHRDVTPSNIFVCYDGSVRVVDFGVAKVSGKLHQTRSGSMKGKFAYMSPEQLAREKIDRRVDLWTLGVVLWESLTCQRLFRRDSEIDTVMAISTDPIALPSSINPAVPPALDAIVMKALRRDRDERYATADEMGRDLRDFLASQPQRVDMPDIADWMRTMLPEDLETQTRLVRRARSADSVALALTDQSDASLERKLGSSSPPSHSGVATRPGKRQRTGPFRPGEEPSSSSVALAGLPPKRSTTLLISAIVVAGAVAAGAMLGLVVVANERQDVNAIAAEAPVAAPPTPDAVDPAVPHDVVETVQAAEPSAGAPSPNDEGSQAAPPPTEPEIDDVPEAPVAPAPTPPRVRRPRPTAGRPAEQPTDPAPGPTEPGSLTVVTNGGWADVYVDGRAMGRTPRVLTLDSGPHNVDLRYFGEDPPVRHRVDVPPGGSARLVQTAPTP